MKAGLPQDRGQFAAFVRVPQAFHDLWHAAVQILRGQDLDELRGTGCVRVHVAVDAHPAVPRAVEDLQRFRHAMPPVSFPDAFQMADMQRHTQPPRNFNDLLQRFAQ